MVLGRLRRDPEGRLVILAHEKGISLEPPQEAKARLKKEYGLYPENWREPFGARSSPQHEEYGINVINVGDEDMPYPPPRGGGRFQRDGFLKTLIGKLAPPIFSGLDSDFADFSREWKRYLHVMCPDGVDQPEGDILILETLRGCLDVGARNRLASALERNTHLTYNDFWRELEREYTRDLTSHYRREWEKVTLGGARRLTPQMWRVFESEFSLKATRVGDVTEREMEERLMSELPLQIRRKLKEENYRVSRSRYWVKFMEPLPLPTQAMEEMVAALVGHEVA